MIALLSLLSLACSVVAKPDIVGVATAADHHRESHERACERNLHVAGDACTFDTECEVCHDGSACGTVMHRDRVATAWAPPAIETTPPSASPPRRAAASSAVSSRLSENLLAALVSVSPCSC